MQTAFMLIFVYAFNQRAERRELWSYLENQSIGCNIPWLVLGVLNSVLNQEDKIGGNPIIVAEILNFHNCVESCGLLEMSTHGSRYS